MKAGPSRVRERVNVQQIISDIFLVILLESNWLRDLRAELLGIMECGVLSE